MSVDSMTAWADKSAASLMLAEVAAAELFLITDSPEKARRRFTVRRVPVRLRFTQHPWLIKDREHPGCLGYAPSFDAAMSAVGHLAAGRSTW